MWKKLSIALCTLAFIIGMPRSSKAETVLEKVARTGILTVGTRINLIPYSYVNDKQQLVGYSIDVVNLIKKQLEAELGKEITLQVVVDDNFADRIRKIKSGEIDISCDTAFTWERDKYVDFSVSYGISGIRLLVLKNSSLGAPETLVGKRIGVAPNTTAAPTIKVVQPKAIIVPLKSVEEGFTALQKGEIDAIAGDTVVLDGLAQRINPNAFKLVPDLPYARYGVSCMVPENNSQFLDSTNFAIVKMMQGYVNGDRTSVALVSRWFGPQGIIDLDPVLIRAFFQSIIITREQVRLDSGTSSTTQQ